jgi:nucleoside-diphosphate-sugar epimerase
MSQTQSNNILVTGASGMIGSALVEYLSHCGFADHQLSRHSSDALFYFDGAAGRVHMDSSIPLLAVITWQAPVLPTSAGARVGSAKFWIAGSD